ncbi:MAG: hypothetical protein OSA99_10845 [Acidimicrobiales bacterium]|nr:hypothetical protein [Acidimicrobiales bacterium]
MRPYVEGIERTPIVGPGSDNPLASRRDDADRLLDDRTMAEDIAARHGHRVH